MKTCICLLPVLLLICCLAAVAQTETATISGRITDPQGAVVGGADVQATNIDTNITTSTRTNTSGIYVIPSLPPGNYRLIVRYSGFKEIVKTSLTLHVQDTISQNFAMEVGSTQETVTVTGDAQLVNTQDAAVSTVVDRNFAENLPLNGRSFQSLIELAPGVVLTPTSGFDFGQFSVNGQRATSNYWMVDGVSANIGTSGQAFQGSAAGGAVGSFSALGGTNGLVSVDAMQEFRIQTSSFAPEFGRTPGGQISIATRSGTNQFHGLLFEYFRNDVLDANDWFLNHAELPKPAERQNDFGGTFGGPIFKDKTFLFFSYEGLRLRLPKVGVTTVPDLAARQSATPATQPYLNAYPQPSPGGQNYGDGTADANYSFSNRASLDAYSIRVDHRLASKFTVFGRYNYSPSELLQRGGIRPLSQAFAVDIATQTATVGTTWTIAPSLVNDLRFNYSRVTGTSGSSLDTFGGAVVPPVNGLFPSPFTTKNAAFTYGILGLSNAFYNVGNNADTKQQQFNVTDSISILKGAHTTKVGIDYRRLFPKVSVQPYTQLVLFGNVATAASGNPLLALVQARQSGTVLFQNFSAFAQDTWRVKPRLTLTYGLRWDIDVSPSSLSGPTLQSAAGYNLNDLSNLAIAPAGKSLYKTTYGNIAPRLGIAYQVHQSPNWQTVVRGGFGVFYDLVSPEVGSAIGDVFPFSASKLVFGGAFPLSGSDAAPPAFTTANFAGGAQAVLFDPKMKLPYTLQWNIATEQALGNEQTLSISYLGAGGRRLVQSALIPAPNANFVGSVDLIGNTATSYYHALQVQFQRRLSHGLQALASYTWSHSIDDASLGSFSGGVGGSSNTLVPGVNPKLNRGPSDFDIRNSFSAGITYAIPAPTGNSFPSKILKGWSIETFTVARSAPPVNIFNSGLGFTLLGATTQIRPNVVPGQPLYLTGPQFPGGKAINPNAFVDPPAGQQGNLGRNALRGFGLTQWDFAVHRDFPIRESVRLQFRAEMFNVLNHPNFGPPVADLSSPSQFGQATQLLASSLDQGSGGAGLNALHQIGGPRSIQFALRLHF